MRAFQPSAAQNAVRTGRVHVAEPNIAGSHLVVGLAAAETDRTVVVAKLRERKVLLAARGETGKIESYVSTSLNCWL